MPVLRDKRVEQLEGASIADLRNQVVFRFDDAPIAEGIRDIDLEELVLVAMKGRERKDVYYQLADEVVLRLSHALEVLIVDGAQRLGLEGTWDA